jgi:hypothetical protein
LRWIEWGTTSIIARSTISTCQLNKRAYSSVVRSARNRERQQMTREEEEEEKEKEIIRQD